MGQKGVQPVVRTARSTLCVITLLFSESVVEAVPTILIFSEVQSPGIPLEGVAIDSIDRVQWRPEYCGCDLLKHDPLSELRLSKTSRESLAVTAMDMMSGSDAARLQHDFPYAMAARPTMESLADWVSTSSRPTSSLFWIGGAIYRSDNTLGLPEWYPGRYR